MSAVLRVGVREAVRAEVAQGEQAGQLRLVGARLGVEVEELAQPVGVLVKEGLFGCV